MSDISISPQESSVPSMKEKPVHGYPSLAHFVGKEVGYAMFRRFASLNAKTLLDLQAELVQLEHELNDLEVQNSKYDEKEALQCRVSELKNAHLGSSGHKQWQKVLETREKLEYYSKSFSRLNGVFVTENFAPRLRTCRQFSNGGVSAKRS